MDYKNISKTVIKGWIAIVSTIALYCIYQYYLNNITLSAFIKHVSAVIIPFVIGLWAYNCKNIYDKWIYSAGFIVTYGIFSFSGIYYILPYIFPIMSLIVLFKDKKLIIITGGFSFLIQVISICLNNLSSLSISEIFINQCICILLCIYNCCLSSNILKNMYKEGMHNIHVIDRQNSKIEDMMSDTIFVIAQTIDAKDSYTKGHSKRVALYSKIIAIKLGHSVEFCENIYKIGFLHDIGKMGIDDQILNKPDKLTDEEYTIMKSHVNIGAKIVKEVKYISYLYEGVKYHHERWDGKGYPDGLSEKNIPEVARIVAGADMLDAMSSTRCYRKRLSRETIVSEIIRSSGTQLDPDVSKAILDLIDEGIFIID